MNLVLDANVLISSLIKEGKSAELLPNFSFNLFVPEFIFEEFEKHRDEVLEKTHRGLEEFWKVYAQIKKLVDVVPMKEFDDYLEEAERICPDPDDVMYFALALKLKCAIWSNDLKLKEQSRIEIYTTEELARI
jgi:predicted nucleic acid-binding protein